MTVVKINFYSRELSGITFVASLDDVYMTSLRIGELLRNTSKASMESAIGYEIYEGDTDRVPAKASSVSPSSPTILMCIPTSWFNNNNIIHYAQCLF